MKNFPNTFKYFTLIIIALLVKMLADNIGKLYGVESIQYKMTIFGSLLTFSLLILIWLIFTINAQKRKNDELIKNGYRTEASIEDNLYWKEIKYRHGSPGKNWKVEFKCFPVLKFKHESGEDQIHIYTSQPAVSREGVARKLYEIGDIVEICYLKSDWEIDQLDMEKKVFMDKHYENMKILSHDEANEKSGLKTYTKPEVKIYSIKYGEDLQSFPKTNITEENIVINDEKMIKAEKKENIRVIATIAIIFGIGLVFALFILLK